MNFGNDQWNRADLEFNHWLKGNKTEGNFDQTNILKATYFVFREKETERLNSFCNKAFEVFKKRENDSSIDLKWLIQENNFELSEDILSKEVPMFRKSSKIEDPHFQENITKADNERMMGGILSEDQQTFDNLYKYEFPKVVRLVTKNLGTLDEAKDIFQDALIVLIEKVYRKYLDLTCSMCTYLYSICRNLWREYLRKVKHIFSLDDSYSYLNPTINFMFDETIPDAFEDVNKAISLLGEPCKQLLECYYYENLNWAEIAGLLGYTSAASARNQKYKCLERIRNLVNG